MEKTGRYDFLAEPFHCDAQGRLFMGHLGNHLLNAADYHSTDRGFGIGYLNTVSRTWVLSRLAIEMSEMPRQYDPFTVETWVESAMRYFTNRNFCVTSGRDGRVLGYARSVWAMIDTQTRQPADILAIDGGAIGQWIESGRPCPMDKGTRVKTGGEARLVRTLDTYYSDVDINGHVNSVKYIEHVLDLWPLDWHASHPVRRLETAYVAEARQGDRLQLWQEPAAAGRWNVRLVKEEGGAEVARCRVVFG